MHFGRASDTENLPTDLPNDPLRTSRFLALAWGGKGRILAGCPLWGSRAFVGPLYPPRAQAKDFLRIYAQRYDTVELNSTFYQQLPPDRLCLWRDQVPDSFRFCPKVYRGITEQLGSPELPRLVKEFFTSVAALEGRLGLIFAQLPESFSPRYGALLARFLKLIPSGFKLGVEFRHPDFFQEHALLDQFIDLLYRAGVATVVSDTSGRRDALHLSLTQPRIMVRFLGNLGHPSDEQRLKAWAERVRLWTAAGLDEFYFMAHQAEDKLIPQTVEVFEQALIAGMPSLGSTSVSSASVPVQKTLFDSSSVFPEHASP